MLEAAFHWVRKTPQIINFVTTNPIEAWLRVQAKVMARKERRRPPCSYDVDTDWDRRLHEYLGVSWPCIATAEFRELWPIVMASLKAKGLEVGVGFFAGWNDGELEIARALWCVTRHLRPARVVETGVARGVTSRFILEALECNGAGHLWSIDLPPPLNPGLKAEVGAAVYGRCSHRWSYIEGSSRRRLPRLLASLGQIDLFVHDSSHTEYNTRFELGEAWARLRPGGVAIVDDIDLNWGFRSFTQSVSDQASLVCLAEPAQRDPSRFDGRGLFGILRKIQ